jgi:hypothetical protein
MKMKEKDEKKTYKDLTLYLDNESYLNLQEIARILDMSIQDYILYRFIAFFLNNENLAEKSKLRGGNRVVRIRVSKKIYDGLKKFTNEKTSLSDVIRRVILPERGEIK